MALYSIVQLPEGSHHRFYEHTRTVAMPPPLTCCRLSGGFEARRHDMMVVRIHFMFVTCSAAACDRIPAIALCTCRWTPRAAMPCIDQGPPGGPGNHDRLSVAKINKIKRRNSLAWSAACGL